MTWMTETGVKLDDLVRWLFRFYPGTLRTGLREYVEGSLTLLEIDGELRGAKWDIPYVTDGLCNECAFGEPAVLRGICRACYNDAIQGKYVNDYPTKDFVANVEGYTYWVLNNHLDRVADVAIEFGYRLE